MRPESMHPGHRLSRRALTVLALVPLLAVIMLLGLVRGGRDAGVQAAVVNLDHAVQVDGKLVPLGRQLTAEMVARDGSNISWTLADLSDAEVGLSQGRYAAVVVIPEEFSEAATSFSANDASTARQARVQVTVSENAPVTDAAVAREIAALATDTVNKTLTKSYLENIYIGFNTVGEKFRQIVDGAARLDEGGSQLADGVNKATEGSTQLETGLGTLVTEGEKLEDGALELSEGAGQLAAGADQLATGGDELSAGADALAKGLRQLNQSAPKLVAGVDQLSEESRPLLGGIPEYTDGASQVVDGVAQLRDGLVQLENGLRSQGDSQKLAEVQAALAELSPALREIQTAINTHFPGVNAHSVSLEDLRTAAAEFDAQLNKVKETLAAYASGNAPLPPEAQQIVDELVAGWECPVTDPDVCEQMRTAYTQGVTKAMSKGFQEGAKTVSELLEQKDPRTGKTPLETARDFSRMGVRVSESLVKLRDALTGLLPDGTDPLEALQQLPTQLAEKAKQLTGGVTRLREGADALVEGGQPLKTNGPRLTSGANQLMEGIRTLQTEVGQLPAGTQRLSEGGQRLADGVRQLTSGTSRVAQGASGLAAGSERLASGTGRYVGGVQQAALGAADLSSGLLRLGDGAGELSEGLGQFHSELADGASQLPHYDEADRAALSESVASPIAKDTQLHGLATVSIAALLAVSALWLGSALAYAFAQPVPSDLVSSSRSSVALWARTLGLPAAIGAGAGLLLGLVVGVVLSLPAGRTMGVAAVLAPTGVSFTLVNHALAAWLGNAGRGAAGLLLVATIAFGLTSRVPGWLVGAAGVSPLHNGLMLIRTLLAGGSGLVALAGMALLLGVIALGLSYLAIASRRSLTGRQFRRRVSSGADA